MSERPWRILTYDTREFPLAERVAELLRVGDLEALDEADHVTSREDDQSSDHHKAFYAALDGFLPLYRRFATHVLGGERRWVYVQRVPTFRVHLRGSRAVGARHNDAEYGHDRAEVNFWVPLTRAYGNNTVWIAGEPAEARYGEVVVFDGASLDHWNEVNDTPISRVSFDFRSIPRSVYRPREDRSVSAGVRFALGEYWDDPDDWTGAHRSVRGVKVGGGAL